MLVNVRLHSKVDLTGVHNSTSDKKQQIAVVGMSCRFPGNVNSPEEFWNFLQNSRGSAKKVPLMRWNMDKFYNVDRSIPKTCYTNKGHFIE